MEAESNLGYPCCVQEGRNFMYILYIFFGRPINQDGYIGRPVLCEIVQSMNVTVENFSSALPPSTKEGALRLSEEIRRSFTNFG